MKNRVKIMLISCLLATLDFSIFAQGTAFTYQGRLNSGTNVATGSFDLRFALFDAATAGTQQGNLLTNTATGVTNGLFAVTLDFGSQFPGANRWLELGVRTNGNGAFTTLAPRQALTPTPYAITASNLSGMLPAAQLSGNILNGNLPASPTFNGTVTSLTGYSGNGASLTSLNASQLTTGTLADARLSTNVALLNGTNSFTGTNNFAGVVNATNLNNIIKGTFTGSGAGLSGLNANNLANGTISLGLLPTVLVTNGASGVSISGTFSGNGTGVTNVLLGLLGSGGAIGWGNILSNSSPSVGSLPDSVVAADVNGDGKMDLISANDGGGTLSVLTNNGNGGFVLASSLGVGVEPSFVTAADVNGDGKVDLICAIYGNSFFGYANILRVLTNNGSGGFVLASSPAVGSLPVSVVAADINGDGKVDLISANINSNTLTVLTNTGTGVFGSNATLVVGSRPQSVVAADVNGDGRVDLISANYGDSTLTVLTNNGGGVFGSNATLVVGSGPYAITAADVNGDGKVDLISANAKTNTLTVLTNNGSGGFGLAASLGVGSNPESVAAADVNGDGKVDLISANYSSSTLSVLFNTPTFNGTFSGDGSGLTAINGGNITSGTVADARLSANVALLNGVQTFTSVNMFNNAGNSFTGTFTGNGSGLTSLTAANLSGSVPSGALTSIPAANLTGTVADARLSANVPVLNGAQTFSGTNMFNNAGNSFTGTFTGNGSGVTNLSATQLASGTVADTRLSTNVALLNSAQTFSGAKTFSSELTASNSIRLNGSNIWFLGGSDVHHGLGYYGSSNPFGSATPDGPVLFGYGGGVLGASANGGYHPVLTWTPQRVLISSSNTNGYGNAVAYIANSSTDAVNASSALRLEAAGNILDGVLSVSSTTGVGYIARFGNSTGYKVDISTNGSIVAAGTVTANGVLLSSDRNAKENFTPLDSQSVLAKVAALSITKWNYKNGDSGVHHVGPMAQDFQAAFGLNGTDDKHISVVDESGVALAAIQGLNQKLEEQKAENAELKTRLEKLEQLLSEKK